MNSGLGFKNRKIGKTEIVLFLIFALGFSIRMLFYFYTMNKTNFNGLTGGYIYQADSFLSGEHVFMTLSEGRWILETVHPKGYSMLTVCLKLLLSGNFMFGVHLIQAFVDSLVCILLYQFSTHIFKDKLVGIFGALLYAIYPGAVFNSLQELPDAFSCFFLTLSVYVYFRSFKGNYTKYVLLGCIAGIAMYFRSELTYVPFILLFCDLIKRINLKELLIKALLIFMPMLVLQLPWSIYAYEVSGSFNTQASTMWGSMYESFGEDEDNPWGIQVDDSWMDQDAISKGFAGGAWTSEANEYYKGECIRYIATYPDRYLGLVVNRLGDAFAPGSFTLFNLNRSYTNISGEIKEMCSLKSGLDLSLCMKSNAFAVNYETNAAKLSFVLFVGMIVFLCVSFKKWKEYLPLYLLWLYLPIGMALIKRIEPRNVAGNTGITILCFSWVVLFGIMTVCRKLKRYISVSK